VHNVPLVFPQVMQSDNFVPSIPPGLNFGPPNLATTRVGFTTLDPHAETPQIQQASVSVERQLGAGTMIQVGYIGAWGKNFDRAVLVNNATPAPGPVQPRRPYQTISFLPGTELPPDLPGVGETLTFPVGPINRLENNARTSYNAGWILVKRNFSNGLSFLANYTYAKSFSDGPDFRSPAMEAEVPQNSYDLAAEWGPAGCDIRHRFVGSAIYRFPYSARVAGPSVLRRVLGDWQVSLIFQAQSGFPFTVSVFGDTANAGTLLNVYPIRANAVPGEDPNLPSDQRNADHWFNTAAFATPAAFTFGNVGRNTMTGPPLYKADLALDKEIPFAGDRALHFRVEAFNVFNHTNLGTPNRFVNTPQFGTITDAMTPARQIQFVLRYMF
jgi:hypothetical protein